MNDNDATHILIVEDNCDLGLPLRDYLQHHGYTADMVNDHMAMHTYLAQHAVDLIMLDVMLGNGKMNGLEILKELRLDSSRPVVMWSACGEEEVERILGLEFGADDYLSKSMGYREILARIRAVLRRNQIIETKTPHKTYSFGEYTLDITAHSLYNETTELKITNAEFNLLQAFVMHPNQTLTRDNLMNILKGYNSEPYDRLIDVCVRRLRKKIEPDPSQPVYIRTVWGTGYLFSPEGEQYRPN